MRFFAITIIFVLLSSGAGLADEGPDYNSPVLETRLKALDLLYSQGDAQANVIVQVFKSEPRSINWQPGQQSLKLSAIAGLGKFSELTRRKLLLKFLAIELAAVREDIVGMYERSRAFRAFLDACLDGLVRNGDKRCLSHLREIRENPQAIYESEICTKVFVAEYQLADRIEGRTNVGAKVINVLPNLTGRFWSKDDYQKRGVWKPDAVVEYGSQAYLESLSLASLEFMLLLIENNKESIERRSEMAYVASRVMSRFARNDEIKSLPKSATVAAERIVNFLNITFNTTDAPYIGFTIREIQSIDPMVYGVEFAQAVNGLTTKIEESRKAQVPEEPEDIRKRLREAEAKLDADLLDMRSKRERELITKLDAMRNNAKPKDIDFLMNCANEKDSMVALKALEIIRRLGSSVEGRNALNLKVERLASAFSKHTDNWMMLGSLASVGSILGPNQQKNLLRLLRESTAPINRVGATLVVRISRDEALLSEIKQLLLDKNSWVRRCAEETFDGLDYKTWRGEVIGGTNTTKDDTPEPTE